MSPDVKRKAGRPLGTKTGNRRHLSVEEMTLFMKAAREASPAERLMMGLAYYLKGTRDRNERDILKTLDERVVALERAIGVLEK